jgi:hypothetical protein
MGEEDLGCQEISGLRVASWETGLLNIRAQNTQFGGEIAVPAVYVLSAEDFALALCS